MQLPRRSVTFFFVPLIDVLLLLFCIFLLMPFVPEEDTKTRDRIESVDELENRIKALLKQIEEYRQKLSNYQEKQIPVASKSFQERVKGLAASMRILDFLPDREGFSFYDPKTGKTEIFETRVAKSQKDVERLIKRLEDEAGTQELVFMFLTPRVDSGYPTVLQKQKYQNWFHNRAQFQE
jgi:DNA repair exonuclease SbcCD ATPase subunit